MSRVRLLTCLTLALLGCHGLERDNPVDPNAVDPTGAATEGKAIEDAAGAGLSLAVPLPKALATVVDSLVARLEGPDMVPVVKPLDYPSPLGPATLTIGALSPGEGRTLTIEGYDLTGRLILSGSRSNITIVIGDTTRIAIDLRLAVDPDELDTPDTGSPADTTTAPADTTTAPADTTGAPADTTTAPADTTTADTTAAGGGG